MQQVPSDINDDGRGGEHPPSHYNHPMNTLCTLLLFCSIERPDVLIADFEGKDYGAWTTTGTAFGIKPAQGTLPGQMHVSGYLGKGLVNSFLGGDDSVGTLTSPAVPLERKYVNFLIGGGHYPGKTCINLLVDGKVVRTATGPNQQPGGTEELDWQSWDVSDLQGKSAVFQMVDQQTGGWGHITIDHILQSDKAKDATQTNAQRQIDITHRYLLFPVKHQARKRVLTVQANSKTVRAMDIELAEGQPDWWAFLDVSAWKGQKLTLMVDRLPVDSTGLSSIYGSDAIPGQTPLYAEKQRPQLHFSSRRGWLNDPNGLVYHKGEYHLFYQHNPYGWDWGNMHWGHAVSSDMLHWKELPIALYPHQYGDMAFSGSAIVDTKNTSGWGTTTEPAMVAAYTSTGRGECIVFSTDRGRTWKEYDRNPVVKHQGRDPRLLWHEPTKSWVMAVYDESNKSRNISFYTSPNLKEWKYESRVDGFFECPDLYELPIGGKPGECRWVLSGASQEYVLGQFDGKKFTPETVKLPGHFGKGYYAAQTFSQMPDGRRVIVFWLQAPTPSMPFNQAMSIPLEVALHQTSKGLRLCYQPIKELEKQRVQTHDLTKGEVRAELADIDLCVQPDLGTTVELTIRGVLVQYEVDKAELRCQGMKANVPLVDGKLKLRAIVDRTSLELIAGQGEVLMPVPHVFADSERTIRLKCDGMIERAKVYELRSVWK